MKSRLILLLLLGCATLSAQRSSGRSTTPKESEEVKRRGIRRARRNTTEVTDGQLIIEANQTYVVMTNSLELESLVMMDGATLGLRHPKTTLIVQSATIGKRCRIVGTGGRGRPGAKGKDGVIASADKPRLPPGSSPNGQNGKPGGKGGPAKQLDMYIESISFREPLTILLQGGPGGKGGDGGDGAAKSARRGTVTVGTNGGNGGKGGAGGAGALPRIMYGDGVNHKAIIAKNLPGRPGLPGKGGKAGPVYVFASSSAPKTKNGKSGANGSSGTTFGPGEETDAGVETNFPYPPPKPSAMVSELPLEIPVDATLGNIEDILRAALQSSRYDELRYYKVPEGFAIVTGMEQFTEEGKPLKKGRWKSKAEFVSEFSLANYLKSLFTARKGYFRLIVFMVTADDMAVKNVPITRSEALGWFGTGWTRLPNEIGTKPFTTEHYVSALIYEFSVSDNTDGPVFSKPSSLSAEAHLRGAALWNRLVLDR